jgi:hypothetical protein
MALCGKRVCIAGIRAKPELNGEIGDAVSFDISQGRYSVRLASGQVFALKRENLCLAADDAACAGTAALPYGGDLQAAIRVQDRAAIRTLMARGGEASSAGAAVVPPAADGLGGDGGGGGGGGAPEEEFSCAICKEMLHKPCVSACGHTFCFWCLHHAMDPLAPSHCPLCRAAFVHFASPCVPLHAYVGRRFPEASDAREREVRRGASGGREVCERWARGVQAVGERCASGGRQVCERWARGVRAVNACER